MKQENEITINNAYKQLKKKGFKNQRDCFKQGIAIGVEIGKQIKWIKMKYIHICQQCKKQFFGTPQQKYCSKKCKQKYYKSKMELEQICIKKQTKLMM